MIPVYSVEEAGALQALKCGPQGWIPLENRLKHLTARCVQIARPVYLDARNVLQGLLNGGSLEGIKATNELADEYTPAPNISRVRVAARVCMHGANLPDL